VSKRKRMRLEWERGRGDAQLETTVKTNEKTALSSERGRKKTTRRKSVLKKGRSREVLGRRASQRQKEKKRKLRKGGPLFPEGGGRDRPTGKLSVGKFSGRNPEPKEKHLSPGKKRSEVKREGESIKI